MRMPKMRPLSGALLICLHIPALVSADQGAVTTQQNPQTPDAAAEAPDSSQTLDAVQVQGSALGYKADTSTVGAKTPTATRDIPQTVTVLDRSLLQAQGATSFQDALRNVPGITIGGAEGGQIGNNINLRGFTARTDIFLDGFRDRGQYYRDTFDLDSIEVLKGPSSMLFGRGSTGGAINQVSKQATLDPEAEVSTTIGTDDRYRVTGDFDEPLSDSAAARVSVFGQDNHSTRDVLYNKDAGIAPALRLGIDSSTQITLSALLQHNNDMPDYGVPPVNGHPAPVNLHNFYGLSDDHTEQDISVLAARIEHHFSDAVTLRNQTQYSHYTIDARETAASSEVTADGVTLNKTTGNYTTDPLEDIFAQLGSHDRDIHDSSLYNTTDLITKIDTGSVTNTLITGAELGRDIYTNQGYTRSGLPLLSLLDPVYMPTPANVTTTVGNFADGHANSIAAYVNDSVKINPEWQVVGGARRDRYDADLANTTSLPGLADQTVYFTSVRGGIIYQPTYEQSYYVSYGTSFDPSLETLTVTNGTQALPPEKNKSFEVGSKWDLFDDRLNLTAALFQIEQTNARTQTSAGEYVLDGNIRVRGGELGATGHLTEQWQIFAGYTRLDALIVKALDGTQGNVPANTPANSATVWNSFELSPEWELNGGFTYLSQRYAANTDVVSVGGYTRWDTSIAYHQPKYDVRLNLLNLTNKQYYDALIPSDGGRAIPGIGRTALVTVDYRF
jgi:catecholate siderophore receptor